MLGDGVRRRQGARGRPKGGHTSKPATGRWRSLLLGIPLALILPFGIGYLLAMYVLFPPQEVAAAGIAVPELVGRSGTDAQRALAAAGLGSLEVEELPHPDEPAGVVLAQSPLPGQQLLPGAGVRVAVSAGPARVVVPDVIGFSADRAESLIRRSGFEVQRAVQDSPIPAGRVLRVQPQPGSSVEVPSRITLVVSAGPPQPLPADTLLTPPDTLGVVRP